MLASARAEAGSVTPAEFDLRYTTYLAAGREKCCACKVSWDLPVAWPSTLCQPLPIKPAAAGSDLTMTYTLGGYSPRGVEALAKVADTVLKGRFASSRALLGG